MKRNVNFTRGEWMAALVLLAFILGSYVVYYLYDSNKGTPAKTDDYALACDSFNRKQLEIRDSLDEAFKHRFDNYHYRKYAPGDTNPPKKYQEKKPMYDIVKVDLNRCDTNDIMNVPQFGSKRAARLVEYRDKLGGFYSLEQLKEVYVLQNMELSFLEKYFYVGKGAIKKININEATYKQLIAHPYFDAYLTKTILNYRNKNGSIQNLKQLQQITHAYPELMDKLQHYIEF